MKWNYSKCRLVICWSSSLLATFTPSRAPAITITVTKSRAVSFKARWATRDPSKHHELIREFQNNQWKDRRKTHKISKWSAWCKLPGTITRWATKWPTTSRLWLFLQSGRDNFRGKIQVSPQKLNPIIGKVPVVVHPCKCLTNIFLGFEALHELNNLEIGNINLRMLCKIVVLFCIANSLYRFKKKLR